VKLDLGVHEGAVLDVDAMTVGVVSRGRGGYNLDSLLQVVPDDAFPTASA
jgi:hypothetical protein